jgi:hypothetical protein
MARRVRRSPDDLIADLKDKIRRLEDRKRMQERKNDPVLQEAARVIRSLRRAERFFEAQSRLDLANSAKAARLSIEGQAFRSGE